MMYVRLKPYNTSDTFINCDLMVNLCQKMNDIRVTDWLISQHTSSLIDNINMDVTYLL